MTHPDLDAPQTKSIVKALKEIDPQLAFLALLTCQGIKPLSRWAKPADDQILKLLPQLELLTGVVLRSVKIGKIITETIFSRTPGYIQLYQSRWDHAPIDKSPPVQRFEGFLFGFPPCCVDEFIRHPYRPNRIDPQDQKILFHWACNNCQITPLLLPAYRRLNAYLADL